MSHRAKSSRIVKKCQDNFRHFDACHKISAPFSRGSDTFFGQMSAPEMCRRNFKNTYASGLAKVRARQVTQKHLCQIFPTYSRLSWIAKWPVIFFRGHQPSLPYKITPGNAANNSKCVYMVMTLFPQSHSHGKSSVTFRHWCASLWLVLIGMAPRLQVLRMCTMSSSCCIATDSPFFLSQRASSAMGRKLVLNSLP